MSYKMHVKTMKTFARVLFMAGSHAPTASDFEDVVDLPAVVQVLHHVELALDKRRHIPMSRRSKMSLRLLVIG